MSAHNTPPINYDGPEAESILSRSVSQWQAALRQAKSIPGFPENSYKLERLLSRVPSLPNHIPSSFSFIEGYSTWQSSDASSSLEYKTEKRHTFHLRRLYPTTCWAYILNTSLAERQHLSLQYGPLDKPSGSIVINLDYASPQELTWWNVITARGTAYSIAADNRCTPWAVLVDNLDLEIVGEIDVNQSLPTASQAAGYLARLCVAYGLRNQCSAALAAALSLPLHCSTAPFGPVTIELPRPSLSTRIASPPLGQHPTDSRLLDRYMTLSLSPSYFSSTLWSVFLEPNVPCNFAGAWLGPVSDVLRPIIQDNELELLAKVLSFTKVAPLWLGLAIYGRGTIIKSIMPFLDELRPYPHVQPFVDAAAWTGIPQSFIDIQPFGPYLQDGKISRANIWRLRHDCYQNYEDDSFLTTPQHGWPPFGTMQLKDIEFEILDHLKCSHQWKYNFWTWLPSGLKDSGFLDDRKNHDLLQEPLHIHKTEAKEGKSQQWRINYAASQAATRRIFGWCSSQVEKGFGGSVVPRRECYSPLKKPESDVSVGFEVTHKRIDEWRKTLLYRQQRNESLRAVQNVRIL